MTLSSIDESILSALELQLLTNVDIMLGEPIDDAVEEEATETLVCFPCGVRERVSFAGLPEFETRHSARERTTVDGRRA